MAYFEDPVAEALAPITDASPEELAEYVRAIASTRPNISVEYISNLLLQDGLVNVQGQELTSYISRALDRILGTNGNKVSAAPSSSVVHSSTHPTSSNSRRTTNSSTSNSSRPASYPKKRERDEPQRRQLYQDRTAGGNSSAGTSPKMWQQSARDSYPSGSRHGMNQSTTSSTMSRPSHTAMNSSNSGGGGSGNAYRSRNALPHSNHTRSTATTTSFNGGGSHPQYHDYSSNATYSQKYNAHSNSNMDEQRRTSPSPSSFKQNQSHNNHRHPHKRNDQYANIAAPPPPPPPPPLPIEEQRTLKLTHVPKSITMVQLSHYFEQHNVTIVSMKLVPSLSDPQLRQHQQQLDPLYHTYVVQCGSHDQANTILQLFPVLGYPCIQITMHPTNLEEGLPELPRPHPSYKPHHQHYVESKMIPTAAVTVTPLNLESEQQQQQQHLLQQEQISSISKTLELKHQQEILLQKQLEMQQKILQKVSDSTEKKGKVLKEILQLQKRLVALRQEILENQNTLATMTSSSTTTTIHLQQEQQSSSPAKRFRLDRRTKKVKVTGYPLEFTTLEKLTQHFSAYGHIDSIVFMEKEVREGQLEQDNGPLIASTVLVTFDTRGSAENAKASGSSMLFSDSSTPIELTMSWYKEPTTTTTTACIVDAEKKVDDALVENNIPRNTVDDAAKNDALVDDAIVDYEEDEDEEWE